MKDWKPYLQDKDFIALIDKYRLPSTNKKRGLNSYSYEPLIGA